MASMPNPMDDMSWPERFAALFILFLKTEHRLEDALRDLEAERASKHRAFDYKPDVVEKLRERQQIALLRKEGLSYQHIGKRLLQIRQESKGQ